MLFSALHATQPAHTLLGILFRSGPQIGLQQMEIIYGADAQNTLTRKPRAYAVHERAARGAEVVGHAIAGGDGAGLAEGFQVVAAAQMLQVRVGDGEVGCEHRRSDFVAVRAVADEGID